MHQERTEFGITFRYSANAGKALGPAWESISDGNRVIVLPPESMLHMDGGTWKVSIPHIDTTHLFVGEEAETRAFCVATLFIRQAVG